MCGIAGIVAPQASRYRDALRKMTDSLSHRGPDGSGMHFFDSCVLGHRRLSVVDLDAGHQPMISPVSSAGITFNGEIYGYRGIRDTLAEYPFRTSSDTEVILALYEKYHHDCMGHIPGMFAFAIWDDSRQELFCARDRFGEKPFYYAFGEGGEFVFASEIKALTASGLVRPVLDRCSLAHYLKHLYIPVGRTIYSNIHTLPPAHCLTWKSGSVAVRRYWSLPEPSNITLDDAVEKFQFLMSKAVDNQLVADVEVGAFLSGGLDSSTVVALAAEKVSRLKTIAFGFGDAINELPYAREIANRYGTEHIELVDSDFNLAELTLAMARVYDEPFADSSNIPTFLISRYAARELKVVLTGDGADELLAGYTFWYRPLYWADQSMSGKVWKTRLAYLASGTMARFGMAIPPSLGLKSNGYLLRKSGPLSRIHAAQNVFFHDHELEAFGLPIPDTDMPELYGGIDDALRMDITDYMPGDILVKTDRASMANSLELRSPFLDVELASFLASLPASLKINSNEDKVILRRAFEERWTDSIRRRSKQGFGAPVTVWLERSDMQSLVFEYLADPGKKIFGYFGKCALEEIAKEKSYRTWIMLVLSIWMEAHDFSG